MSQATATTVQNIRAIGHMISAPAGRFTVNLTAQERVVRVETLTGGGVAGALVEDLSASFATAEAATLVHGAIAEAFKSGATVVQVRRAVVKAARFALAAAHAAPSLDTALTADLQRAVAVYESPEDRVAADDTADRLRTDLTMRALADKVRQAAQMPAGGPRTPDSGADPYGWARLRRQHFDAARRDREAVA